MAAARRRAGRGAPDDDGARHRQQAASRCTPHPGIPAQPWGNSTSNSSAPPPSTPAPPPSPRWRGRPPQRSPTSTCAVRVSGRPTPGRRRHGGSDTALHRLDATRALPPVPAVPACCCPPRLIAVRAVVPLPHSRERLPDGPCCGAAWASVKRHRVGQPDVTLVEPELVVEIGVDIARDAFRWRHPARWHHRPTRRLSRRRPSPDVSAPTGGGTVWRRRPTRRWLSGAPIPGCSVGVRQPTRLGA
jgi:hypothetical protein